MERLEARRLLAGGLEEAALAGYWRFDEGGGRSAADASAQNSPLTLFGFTSFGPGKSGNALLFNGGSIYGQAGYRPALDLGASLTLSAWVRFNNVSVEQHIVGNQSGVSGGYKLLVRQGKLEMEIRDSANVAWSSGAAGGGTSLQAGVWYHLAGVYDRNAGTIRTFINGVLDRQVSVSGMLAPSTGAFVVGRESSSARFYLSGALDELRVYAEALSEEQIGQLAGAVRLTGSAGNDTYLIRRDASGENVLVFQNTPETASPSLTLPRGTLGSIWITGMGGDDQLTVDLSNGGPLLGGGLISFDGGLPQENNTLLLRGTPGSETLTASADRIFAGSTAITFSNIRGPILELGGGLDTLSINDGNWRFEGDLGQGTDWLSLTLKGGLLALNASQHLMNLTIQAGRVVLGASGSVLSTGGLSIAAGGVLDLEGNALIYQSTSSNRSVDLARLESLIVNGRNGGTWDGWGLRSSAAGELTGLALMLNDRGSGRALYGQFMGQAVGVNDVLIRHTFHGDTDLNGQVDADDYFRMNRGSLKGAGGYRAGDVDFSGGVDAGDYVLIDRAFLGQKQAAKSASPQSSQAAPRRKKAIALPRRRGK